jgi:peptide/nickel transport system substrate-binding protein
MSDIDRGPRRLPRVRGRQVVAALAVAALALVPTACADSGSGGDEDAGKATYQTGLINITDAGDPVDGGTLRFGAFSEPALLDPGNAIVSGSTGGLEMAAIYDVLMRWDPESGEVEPRMAESLEPNEDFTSWTLKLRDGVTFSDGTPYDAAAVKWSLDRYAANGVDEARLWVNNVTSIKTPDDRTVVINLNKSWPTFEYLLTTGPGMIVAQSSMEGDTFNPVGAGPFTFVEHAPQERLVLEANPDYWAGKPHLDRIEATYLTDPNATFESFESGGLDLAFLRNPDLTDALLAEKTSGLLNLVALGNVALINGAPGHPGEDPRVRKAMHMAIDPVQVSQRAYEGAGVASNEIFPDYSTWHSDVDALPYDPEAAKKLVAEAKADGFDGKVTYLDASDPASRETALTVKASLEAVGFTVELDLVRTVQEQIQKVSVDKSYDVAGWGISWRESGPFGRMFATLHSEGNLTSDMPTSPEMDALLEEFQGAATLEEQQGIMARIQEQWNEQVPALIFGPTPEFMAWSDSVHGVTATNNSMLLLDEAWIDADQ